MIPVSGLYESHLTVANLDRSIAFYRDVVGLELAYVVPSGDAAFFWVGGRERSMLGLWSIHSSPVRLRLHIAFATELEQVKKSVAILRSKGIVPRSGGGGPELDEPSVFLGCRRRAFILMTQTATHLNTSPSCPSRLGPTCREGSHYPCGRS